MDWNQYLDTFEKNLKFCFYEKFPKDAFIKKIFFVFKNFQF